MVKKFKIGDKVRSLKGDASGEIGTILQLVGKTHADVLFSKSGLKQKHVLFLETDAGCKLLYWLRS